MTSTTQIIRDILMTGKAHTQTEIRKSLIERGVHISQPNISRLLHKLGAVKLVDASGKTQYRLPHETGLIHELTSPQENAFMQQFVLDVVSNDVQIIVYTTPGAASMVARVLDLHRMDLKVLGCIAGDDTIFIAPQQTQDIHTTVMSIQALFKL